MRPTSAQEFDQMMVSLDRHLSGLSLQPHQRGLNAALIVSSALGLSGTPIIGGRDGRGELFSPADLLERVHEWYLDNYGDRAKIDMSPGSTVLLLHGNLWELKLPRIWGTISLFANRDLASRGLALATPKTKSLASHNVLRSIQGMTQTYASKLVPAEMAAILTRFQSSFFGISFLDDLKGHDLFDEARGEYRHSVDALLSGREFGKARWDTAQSAEKIFKGLLARGGHAFPTSGGQGHDIAHLGGLLKDKLGISLDYDDLLAIHCSPKVRYGEGKSTKEQALAAHEALVRVLGALSQTEGLHA